MLQTAIKELKEESKTNKMSVPSKSDPSPGSVKAVQNPNMGPECTTTEVGLSVCETSLSLE